LIEWLGNLDKIHHDKLHPYIINRKYDFGAIKLETADYVDYGKILGITPHEDIVKNILIEVESMPLQVCHRDFQSLNAFIKKEILRKTKIGIIDVQDMCLGPLGYDLASLLYDYKLDIPDKDINLLLKIYCFNTKRDLNQLKRCVQICSLFRMMQATGRHFKIYHKTGRKESLDRARKANKRLNELIKKLFNN
jgi:aminoglycoside/choline kinase family phosphotransferase